MSDTGAGEAMAGTGTASNTSTVDFFRELRDRLGQNAVDDSRSAVETYGRTAMPSAPRPSGVVRPQSRDEVIDCLKLANEHRKPLYPISGGKNWGLGSACPTTDGQVVMDLSGMTRILEVNEQLGYAVIEPGVTQGQLFQYLQDNQIDLWMDATGAGPDATIVGNLMERGYGHSPNGDRFHNSCAFEVVLADGSVIETGWAHHPNSQVSNLFKTGIGPSIDGLFTQSNLGVVTRATIWLIPKPQAFKAYVFRIKSDEELAAVVDALRPLRSLGVINSVVHLANDYRVISGHHQFPYDRFSGEDPLPEAARAELRKAMGLGHWNALGAFYGTKDSVQGSCRAMRKALRGITKPIFIDDAKLQWFDRAYRIAKWIPAVQRLNDSVTSARSAIALLKGKPVHDHLAGSGWRSRKAWQDQPTDPLDRGDGIIWLTPLVPLTGDACQQFLSCVEPIFAEFGFEPLLTFVMISGRVMCCPTTICYDRSSDVESLRAKECYRRLLSVCTEQGFLPYRCGIQSMSTLLQTNTNGSTISKLKHTLDPLQIIAPGRYQSIH
ncbi:MAG: FAD-binding oxidoreductase [Rubripirellula sp.]|nr:FAD-binding oxidoreductase [Rubripirellula sp.]